MSEPPIDGASNVIDRPQPHQRLAVVGAALFVLAVVYRYLSFTISTTNVDRWLTAAQKDCIAALDTTTSRRRRRALIDESERLQQQRLANRRSWRVLGRREA